MSNNPYALMANYNYGSYIKSAIEGCLNQTVKTRLMVVDDASTDDSCKVTLSTLYPKGASSYLIDENQTLYYDDNQNFFISCTVNAGPSVARNLGLRHIWNLASHVLVNDSDDIALPNKVERLISKFFPGVGATYGDYYIKNEKGNFTVPEYKKSYDANLLNYECHVHSQSLILMNTLHKTFPDGEVYSKELHAGKSSSYVGSSEDFLMALTLADAGWLWFHVPELLSVVRVHGDNASRPDKVTSEIFQQNMAFMRAKLQARRSNEQIHVSN